MENDSCTWFTHIPCISLCELAGCRLKCRDVTYVWHQQNKPLFFHTPMVQHRNKSKKSLKHHGLLRSVLQLLYVYMRTIEPLFLRQGNICALVCTFYDYITGQGHARCINRITLNKQGETSVVLCHFEVGEKAGSTETRGPKILNSEFFTTVDFVQVWFWTTFSSEASTQQQQQQQPQLNCWAASYSLNWHGCWKSTFGSKRKYIYESLLSPSNVPAMWVMTHCHEG